MLRDLLLREAIHFTLLFSRIAGFVLTSPFPGDRVPKSSRLGFALLLGFFVRSVDAGPKAGLSLDLALGPATIRELTLGVLVGMVFRMFIASADIGGEIASQAIGLGSASVMNPLFGHNETVISRLFSLAGVLLALTSGAHRVVLAYLMESFAAVPVGSAYDTRAAVPALVDLFVESVSLGVRLGMPAVAVSVLVQLALAMVARVAPSLQIFNVGFAVLIAAGLLALGMTLPDVGARFVEQTALVGTQLERVFLTATSR